jgi:glycosyltransferase involved in cell wall biosynthesis
MRILIINSEFPPLGGGAGNASANLAREFAALDHQVLVVTCAFDSLPREEDWEGVKISRIPALRRRMDRSGAFEQAGFVLSGAFAASKVVRRWRPDVILAFFGVPAGMVALWIRILYKLPYVVSMRGGDVPGFRPYDFATYHRIIAPLLRKVWRRSAALVANSRGLKELAQAFDSRFPIQVIPNGVDLKRFAPPLHRQWSPPRLLFVGRLVYQKGLDILLPALSELKHLPWELTVVGDGPYRGALKKAALALGISERINFTGWQHNDNLVRQYQAANIFVFPSRHEGMPNVVLEAMACGLPVIATSIAGNEELITHGKTGLLVPPEDSINLMEALSALLSNPELCKQIGGASRKRVGQHFAWGSVAKQYIELLNSVTGAV